MAHPLENLTPESRFTAYELIEIELTSLMREMAAAQSMVAEKDQTILAANARGLRGLIDHWRGELTILRGAIRNITPTTED